MTLGVLDHEVRVADPDLVDDDQRAHVPERARRWTFTAKYKLLILAVYVAAEDGVGLDIARDNRTRDAMLRALALLAPEPLVGLRGRRLEADDFDRVLRGKLVRALVERLEDLEEDRLAVLFVATEVLRARVGRNC